MNEDVGLRVRVEALPQKMFLLTGHTLTMTTSLSLQYGSWSNIGEATCGKEGKTVKQN
jgi:hypothetical protein